MRQIWRCRLRFVVLSLLLTATGCASLPRSVPVQDEESDRIRESFLAAMAEQEHCGSGVDADVVISYNSFLQSGAAAGYFQARLPSSIKFIAENPFGQPLFALYSDDRHFVLLALTERLGYTGDVAGETFRKYAPAGFRPGDGFYFLTGRLGQPLSVHTVSRQQNGTAYWLQLSDNGGETHSLVLYDPQQGVIRRHLLVDDHDKPVFDVSYDEYSPLSQDDGDGCRYPGFVAVSSLAQRARLEIRFRNWAVSDDFPDRDFVPVFPDDFHIVQVK